MFFLTKMCTECNGAFGITSGGIPLQIFNIVKLVYNVIRFAVPLILIFVGMLDMAKAVTGKDEAEIKKAQNLLVRKGVTAALVFLIVSLVALLFNIVSSGDSDSKTIFDCVNSFLNGVDENACTEWPPKTDN